MKIRTAVAVAALSLFAWTQAPIAADTPLFTTAFTPAEFAARRARVMNAIGDAVAIISGATETSTYTKFRQGVAVLLSVRRRGAARDSRHRRPREVVDAVPGPGRPEQRGAAAGGPTTKRSS